MIYYISIIFIFFIFTNEGFKISLEPSASQKVSLMIAYSLICKVAFEMNSFS